jgi:hypothetical protein
LKTTSKLAPISAKTAIHIVAPPNTASTRNTALMPSKVREIASSHLAEVRKKLAGLQALESSLSAFVVSCGTACAGGPAVDCTILEDLAYPVDMARLVTNSPCCGASPKRTEGAKPC